MSKVAFIFPGQGVQKAGMGKDFYDQYKTAAKVFDQATELLGIDMKKLCFEENDRLDQTEYTQAALVTVCMAMERVAEEEGLVADVTAGLSLGEYCVIVTAGGKGSRTAESSRSKKNSSVESQWAIPFSIIKRSRKRAGRRIEKCGTLRITNSLCDKCYSGICLRNRSDKSPSCKAGGGIGQMAAEYRKNAQSGCRYFYRDRSGKNTDRIYEKDQQRSSDI